MTTRDCFLRMDFVEAKWCLSPAAFVLSLARPDTGQKDPRECPSASARWGEAEDHKFKVSSKLLELANSSQAFGQKEILWDT